MQDLLCDAFVICQLALMSDLRFLLTKAHFDKIQFVSMSWRALGCRCLGTSVQVYFRCVAQSVGNMQTCQLIETGSIRNAGLHDQNEQARQQCHCSATRATLRNIQLCATNPIEMSVRKCAVEVGNLRLNAFIQKAIDCTRRECNSLCNPNPGPATATGSACEDMTPACIKLRIAPAKSQLGDCCNQMWPTRLPYKVLTGCQSTNEMSKFMNFYLCSAIVIDQALSGDGDKCLPVLSLPISCRIRWRWYLSSERIGEADNPGPDQLPAVCICAFNPTSVYQRSDQLARCGDVVLLSETSATQRVQKIESLALRKLGIRSVWSPPVDPHKTSDSYATSLRGASRGTDPFPAS